MRRMALAMGFGLAVAAFAGPAAAQQPLPPLPAGSVAAPSPPPALPAPAPPASSPAPATGGTLVPVAAPAGLAVIALGGATDAAWPLARSVYGTPSLRPAGLDEARARTLCGEVPAADASKDTRDLAESLAAVKGDDAPSRMLLVEIARRLNVRALVVVRAEVGRAVARVFLPDPGAFDAAAYAPDGGPAVTWSATTASLARTFGGEVSAPPQPSQTHVSAPPLATHEEPVVSGAPPSRKAFYESGWFWGAVGAAAFTAGAIFFATRDNGDSTIHLQATVPH